MRYMLFTCAPGFEMIGAYDTLPAAKGAMADEIASKDVELKDWIGIMPIELLINSDEAQAGGSLEAKGEIVEAVQRLDLRPSEMLVLAKEIAENCSTPQDHTIIQALKDAYVANSGEEMPCPYP